MNYYGSVKQNAIKHCFLLPNGIFHLRLKPGEISVYAYLRYCENRKTYECYPSFETIGKAVCLSKNTVMKYVRDLEGKKLITTSPTMIRTKAGDAHNGTLLYHINPIRDALQYYYEHQMERAEENKLRLNAEKKKSSFTASSGNTKKPA